MDELEKVPGYIAGVTNPRFEDLHAWDLLFNIESGKITIAKDIEPATPMRVGTRQGMTEAISSGSLGSSTGFGPDGEIKMVRAPSEPDVLNSGVSSFSMGGTLKGRDRSATVMESRVDAPENVFMEEILLAVAARYGERYIRSRFSDWAVNLIRQAARHEEHFYGQTSIAPPSQPYLNGQLGSGFVSSDRETELKEIQSNAMRIEAFRATESYKLYRNDEAIRERNRSIIGFDLHHQLARLRKGKKLQSSECELIFTTVAKSIKTTEQIIEVSTVLKKRSRKVCIVYRTILLQLLSLLPAQHGGLFPLSCGLFHSSTVIRSASQDLLVRLATHPVGKKFVQNLNMFHRLAFARLLHESSEVQETVVSTPHAPTAPNLHHHQQSRSMSPKHTVPPPTATHPTTSNKERDCFPSSTISNNTSLTLSAREGLPTTDNPSSSIATFLNRSNSPAAYT